MLVAQVPTVLGVVARIAQGAIAHDATCKRGTIGMLSALQALAEHGPTTPTARRVDVDWLPATVARRLGFGRLPLRDAPVHAPLLRRVEDGGDDGHPRYRREPFDAHVRKREEQGRPGQRQQDHERTGGLAHLAIEPRLLQHKGERTVVEDQGGPEHPGEDRDRDEHRVVTEAQIRDPAQAGIHARILRERRPECDERRHQHDRKVDSQGTDRVDAESNRRLRGWVLHGRSLDDPLRAHPVRQHRHPTRNEEEDENGVRPQDVALEADPAEPRDRARDDLSAHENARAVPEPPPRDRVCEQHEQEHACGLRAEDRTPELRARGSHALHRLDREIELFPREDARDECEHHRQQDRRALDPGPGAGGLRHHQGEDRDEGGCDHVRRQPCGSDRQTMHEPIDVGIRPQPGHRAGESELPARDGDEMQALGRAHDANGNQHATLELGHGGFSGVTATRAGQGCGGWEGR